MGECHTLLIISAREKRELAFQYLEYGNRIVWIILE